jgi:hypothetical protein
MDIDAGQDLDLVSGIDLRRLLTLYLKRHKVMTVKELVAALAADGYGPYGRPSKAVSDALRWEIPWGRVKRLRRGVYAFGRLPRSTEYRMRKGLEYMRGIDRVLRARAAGLAHVWPPHWGRRYIDRFGPGCTRYEPRVPGTDRMPTPADRISPDELEWACTSAPRRIAA